MAKADMSNCTTYTQNLEAPQPCEEPCEARALSDIIEQNNDLSHNINSLANELYSMLFGCTSGSNSVEDPAYVSGIYKVIDEENSVLSTAQYRLEQIIKGIGR